MTTKFDPSYQKGQPFGAITCPKCDCKVLYGIYAKTRPNYCPDCETEEINKIVQHDAALRNAIDNVWDWQYNEKEEREAARESLRRPMPEIQLKTIQELIGNV